MCITKHSTTHPCSEGSWRAIDFLHREWLIAHSVRHELKNCFYSQLAESDLKALLEVRKKEAHALARREELRAQAECLRGLSAFYNLKETFSSRLFSSQQTNALTQSWHMKRCSNIFLHVQAGSEWVCPIGRRYQICHSHGRGSADKGRETYCCFTHSKTCYSWAVQQVWILTKCAWTHG